MRKSIITLVLGLIGLGASASAQTQTLPLLSLGADMRSAGMAGVEPARNDQATLYSTPTDILYSAGEGWRVSYHIGFRPSGDANRATYHQASAGYRFDKRNALHLGWRYFGGMEVPYINGSGVNRGTIHPRDWAIELGYTYRFSRGFSAWGRAGYLQSYNSVTADVATASAGIDYRHVGCHESFADYRLGLSVENFGTKIKYAKSNTSYDQPTLAKFSGSLTLPRLIKPLSLTLGGGMRYALTNNPDHKLVYHFGGELKAMSFLSLRSGYTLSPYGNVWSMGAGVSFKGFVLDCAFDKHEYKDFNLLRLGFSYSL